MKLKYIYCSHLAFYQLSKYIGYFKNASHSLDYIFHTQRLCCVNMILELVGESVILAVRLSTGNIVLNALLV